MIYNIVLVSSVQQINSVIHIHISILFQILFPFRLLQDIEQSSLCYTVGPCWLSVFKYSSVYLLIPNSQFIPLPPSHLRIGLRRAESLWGKQEHRRIYVFPKPKGGTRGRNKELQGNCSGQTSCASA